MALIEGFRVQNYRALRDVTLGKLSNQQQGEPLSPFTVVIGQNGVGKSTLFDAFGFIADCLAHDVETACDMKQRGGFERLRSRGVDEPIRFEVYYREAPSERPITYELSIAQDQHGRPYPFLRLNRGVGRVWAGEEAVEVDGEEDRAQIDIELTDPRQLGIATLGTLKEHPRIKRFRDFLKGWYLSYFYPDAARSLPTAGPQKHLNSHGDNIGNVVQFMEREHKERFKAILNQIAEKIPGVAHIDTKVTDDKRVLLRFNDGSLADPFFAQQMSDGTLKMFTYLLLILAELEAVAEGCDCASVTLFRLAIEEVEAWYLGDQAALLSAYPRAKSDVLARYRQDTPCGTWELLADAVYPGGVAAVRKAGWPLPGPGLSHLNCPA